MKHSAKNILISFLLSISGTIISQPEPPIVFADQSPDLVRFYHHKLQNKKTANTPKDQTHKSTDSLAEWTILILIQASNNLESFAHTNMKEIMKWGSTENVNILVDLHKTGDKSWKYKIERGACVIEEVSARSTESTIEKEVFESAQWAVTNYPAKKLALVFWNHGVGCIDPQISTEKPGYLIDNNWRSPDLHANQLSRAGRNSIPADRGILFDDERQTYLSNQGLRSTLKRISTELLDGQKISLIGMDACLMAMLEIADQIKEYAEYFVASEEFEFAQGWPYGDIIEKLITTPQIDSKELATLIVVAYQRYYNNKTSYYTQSAVALSEIAKIKENLNMLAQYLLAKKSEDPARMKLFIQQARSQALSFSVSDYVDLQSFYTELLKITTNALENPNNKIMAIPQMKKEFFQETKAILLNGLEHIKQAVTANVAGRYLARAGGLSVYFPQKTVDPSYINTELAQTTGWASFIIDQSTH